MDFFSAVADARTCRRFDASRPLPAGMLARLVDSARLTPSAGNLQVLRYIAVSSPGMCAEFYPALRWAAYFKDWDGPEPPERPTGHVVILAPEDGQGKIGKMTLIDVGIAAQTMHLVAQSTGLASCMFGSFDPALIAKLLPIPPGYQIALCMAFGFPVEERVIVPVPPDGSVKYYRDAQGVHYVPKRSLSDVLLKEC